MATIYLHKDNFFYNLDKIHSFNPNVIAVIKDNAYGHGIIEISSLLREYGIRKVCVRNIEEANFVKDFFEEIIVLYPKNIKMDKNISFSVNSYDDLKYLDHKNIHLKVDTGMHRNGILLEELEDALNYIKRKNFNLIGVFSHFCCSDEVTPYTFIQLERFKYVKDIVIKNGFNPYFHLLNSSSLFKVDESFDYVRVGIAMYGGIEGYKPVMELRGETFLKKYIKKSQSIGYNKKYIAKRDMIISLIDLGYADGILYFTNGCKLKDTYALGKISMDSMAVEGDFDEVVIFDDIKEFAKNFDTITYDILVKLSPRIKRVIV